MFTVCPAIKQTQDAERDRQRQRQQDRHRMDERFELRREHDVHEDERQHDREQEVEDCFAHFLRLADIARSYNPAGRTIVFDVAVDRRCDARRRTARFRVREQRDLTLPVRSIDRARSGSA